MTPAETKGFVARETLVWAYGRRKLAQLMSGILLKVAVVVG